MRILAEAMCAEFGGIRTYVEHLLRVWPDVYPADELHVLLRDGSDLPTDPRVARHERSVHPRLGRLGRPLAQTLELPRLVRDIRPDVVLATLPSTTLRRVGVPTAVVVYDLRHEMRPEQFSRSNRLFRAVSYRRGYAIADGFVSISQRSLEDLHERHPRLVGVPAQVAHLGADHVDSWTGGEGGHAVTFAHHSNKNLDLILGGWQELVARGANPPRLRVLGLGSRHREELAARLSAARLGDWVEPAPFLPDDEFQRTLASARLIVFPSDFEGFGLPVAEGMRLGIPVVIGPERATLEVAGGHAVVMSEWTSTALAAAVETATSRSELELADARRFAARYTWAATAAHTRHLLESLSDEANAAREP